MPVSTEVIQDCLKQTLAGTNLLSLCLKLRGKVRDVYDLGNGTMALVVTDRQSAFDQVLALVPFKGQVLNQLATWWFQQICDIVGNHLIAVPHPNVTITRKINPIPVEVVVRAYNTGSTKTSVWTAYRKGEREFCGNCLPDGMVKNQPFDRPILTPTTKSDEHDEQISPAQIIEQGLLTQEQWDEIARVALALFARGQEVAQKAGLILVDTKYEFGYDEDGNLVLIDEIHTPDSSRFWILNTYQERFAAGQEPDCVDKEFLRLWFTERCDPYRDKLPEAPVELVVKMSRLYVDCYERLTGRQFVPYVGDDLEAEIAASLEFFKPAKLAALPETVIQVIIGSRSDLAQVRNAYRFFKALPQIRLNATVASCHRNPEFIRQIAIDFNRTPDVTALVAVAGMSAQLPSALKSWLVCLSKPEIPVFGVGLIGLTDQQTLAAQLAIQEVPGRPVEMDPAGVPFMGQTGMFDALRAAIEHQFAFRTIKPKPYECDIQV